MVRLGGQGKEEAGLKAVVPEPKTRFREDIKSLSGEDVARCYQCGKCTAGCPLSFAMDLAPRRVMRSVLLGLKDEVLSSNTIWLCVQCNMCSARCPRQIEVARVMEACRLIFQKEKYRPGDRDTMLFHKLLLESARRWGRLHELDLAANYNLKSGHLTANLELVPGLISKGKLAVFPHRDSGPEVKKIFARVKAARESRKSKAGGKP
jgi:heterodisulfide reductase subunit C